jgi:hypothetical protein
LENYSGYIYAGRKVFWTRFASGGISIITDDKWRHLAGTYDMKSVKSYVDGVVEAEAPFDGKPDFSPGPLNIEDCPGFAYPVKGIMDEVALFNVAFDKETINIIMTQGLEGALAILSVGKSASFWSNIRSR